MAVRLRLAAVAGARRHGLVGLLAGGLTLQAQALPIEQPAGALPTPLRVFSDEPLAPAPSAEPVSAAAAPSVPVSPSAGAEGAEMGLIVHHLPMADSQGLLSEWMADAQFAALPAAAASGSAADAASGAAAGRLNRQPVWQRTPSWMASGHDADAAVSASLHAVQRDWVPPQPGAGGLGLSTLPALSGDLPPDDPAPPSCVAATVTRFNNRPVVTLPATVRAFLRDNLALILAAVALVVGAAALAKAYARRI